MAPMIDCVFLLLIFFMVAAADEGSAKISDRIAGFFDQARLPDEAF